MAALRVILLLGLCFAASATNDVESLMQREVGVHVPKDEERPSKILESISPQARREMSGLMKTLLDDIIGFLQAAQAPLRNLMSEPVPKFGSWTPEMLSEFTAGYILAFNNTKFENLVAKTAVQVSNAVGELGAKMGVISSDLKTNTNGVANLKDAKNLVQLSVQQMGMAMTTAAGHFFNGMSHLLNGLPTEYMRTTAKSFKAMAGNHTSGAMNDFYEHQLVPYIQKVFAEGDLCDDVTDTLNRFTVAVEAVRTDAVGAISRMNTTVTALAPHIAEMDHDLVPQVIDSLKTSLQQLGSGFSTMAIGFDMYQKELAKVMEEKLNCPKQE